jgi:two-component system sensor histidine kinase DegS
MRDAVHMSSGLLSSALRFIRNPHFWGVLVLFAIGVILYYPEQIIPGGAVTISSLLGTTRHTAERVFFLIPVTYASFIFGLRGGIASLVAAGFIMLPRAIFISQVPVDAILESIGIIIVGGLVNLWFHMHRKDIAQRRSIEESLVRIVDGSSIPLFVINKQHKVTYWNTAMEALTSIKKEEIIGRDEQWQAFYHEKRPVMADLIIDGAPESEIEAYYPSGYKKSQLIEGAYEAEGWFSAPGKSRQCHHFTASPIRNDSGEITGAIETLENVTERKKAEENLRYYLQEITKAQEEERKRIARELHDSSAQNLIALLHQLDNLLTDKTKLSVRDAKALWGFYEQIRDTLQEVRRFSRDLRPSILDDLGLLPALEWVTQDLKNTYLIEVDLRVLGNERRLFPETELLLFRIVQEALRNVAKHAEATRAEVEIKFEEDRVTVTISDDGKGFEPPENLEALPSTGKLGLAGMQERVQLLGGRLKLESKPGEGTKIFVEAPV